MSESQNHNKPWYRAGLVAIVAEVLAIAVLSAGLLFCSAAEAEDAAAKAFELRISGQVDAARELLVDHLSQSPDDAKAHYELARIYYYMGPGNIKEIDVTIVKAGESVARAVELEPDNPTYLFFAARVQFFKSYMGLKRNQGEAADHIANMCRAYENVLQVKPDHGPVLMNLVELYGGLPSERGRDSAKAAAFAARLADVDHVLAAKAHCVMMPEEFDRIGYWTTVLSKYPSDARVLDELGKTCLRAGRTDDGARHLEAAIKADAHNAVLYLVLASHHMWNFKRDESQKSTALPAATEAVNQFLATEPIAPLKAYALYFLARLSYNQGNEAEADKLSQQAEATDAYVSKASAIPHADLFVPPDEELTHHRYLFQPF